MLACCAMGAHACYIYIRGEYVAEKHALQAAVDEAYAARLEGWRQALRDGGLPEGKVYLDTIVRETGFEAGLKAIDAGCDALYSAGDFSALGAVEAARSRGLRIPEDFGIVGTANETFTSLMTPSMSSLALNPFEMGRQAAQAFLEGADGVRVVPMELKVRDSSCRIHTENQIPDNPCLK